MQLRTRSFILATLLSLGAVLPAEAKTISCESIFQPTVKDVLEQVNRDSDGLLFKGPSFEEYTQSMSWMRKRKIRKLMQDIEVRSFSSEKAIERHTILLGEALFGNHTALGQWVKKSSEERLDDSAILAIKEQLLQEGMLKTWGDVQDPNQISILRKTIDLIKTFQGSMVGQALRMPFVLPKIKNQQVSNELLFKIIRDGFNAHAEEVRLALRQQTKIDAYNTFRKVYAPVVFGIMIIVQSQNAYQQLQDAIEQQVRATVEALRNQRKQIEETVPLVKQQEYQKAYDASIAEFTQKWGEPPTAEEASIIKAKIEKALNMH